MTTSPYPVDVEFSISRTFDAPRDVVYKAWADQAALAQWWGPKGMTIDVKTLEFKPGGMFHYQLTNPMGQEMWGIFHYRAMTAPDTIIFVNSFSDPAGTITRAPFSSSWPLEVLNHVTFAEQDGKTTVTLHGGPLNANSDELATFKMMHPSMKIGFGGTLDQLAAYLATL